MNALDFLLTFGLFIPIFAALGIAVTDLAVNHHVPAWLIIAVLYLTAIAASIGWASVIA